MDMNITFEHGELSALMALHRLIPICSVHVNEEDFEELYEQAKCSGLPYKRKSDWLAVNGMFVIYRGRP